MKMTSDALLQDCVTRGTGPFVDIDPLLTVLRSRGWSDERLAKNDLAESAAGGGAHRFRAFWKTIEQLAVEMETLGLPPIFIKCVREYPYCDFNVDFLVPRTRLRSVARHLYTTHWKAPATWDSIEQLLIERAKLKLQATDNGLLAAHLYGGVSWRYQGDIGLLRKNGEQADPEHLRLVPIVEACGFRPSDRIETRIWLPRAPAEFVMQAAHIAFENFRITVGEAVHFRLLQIRSADAWTEARALARGFGCEAALDLVDRESRRVCASLEQLDPADWPRTLPMADLAPTFRERARLLTGQGRRLAALNEVGTASGVYLLVSLIRRLRRWRRGAEDYR